MIINKSIIIIYTIIHLSSSLQKICILNDNNHSQILPICSFNKCKMEFSYKCGNKYCALNEISCVNFIKFKIIKIIIKSIKSTNNKSYNNSETFFRSDEPNFKVIFFCNMKFLI